MYYAAKRIDEQTCLILHVSVAGHATLYLGDAGAREYRDAWEFDRFDVALAELDLFDPRDEAEPAGWTRHPSTGRVRQRRAEPSLN